MASSNSSILSEGLGQYQAEHLAGLVQHPGWGLFLQVAQEVLQQSEQALHTSENMVEIYRAQGGIERVRVLMEQPTLLLQAHRRAGSLPLGSRL